MNKTHPLLLAAASRMLQRSRLRQDFALACEDAEDCFTAIVSVNHRDNIEPAIKLAENHGLEAKLYYQCKIAVTGKREKVLKFQHLLRTSLFGEELPPTEGVHVVKDLKALSHDHLSSKDSQRVRLAIQDLESLHPVAPVRLKQYKNLVAALSFAKPERSAALSHQAVVLVEVPNQRVLDKIIKDKSVDRWVAQVDGMTDYGDTKDTAKTKGHESWYISLEPSDKVTEKRTIDNLKRLVSSNGGHFVKVM